MSRAPALILIILAMISIQYGASFAKGLFTQSGPTLISALRLYTAAFVLLLIWRPWKIKLDRTFLKDLILYGVSLGLMNIFFYWSLARIPLGLAVSIEFIGPLSVSLIKSRRPIDFIWLALVILGLALLLPWPGSLESIDLLGALYALIAGGFWATYIIFGDPLSRSPQFGAITSWGMLIAAMTVTPFCISSVYSAQWSTSLLTSGILVGVLSSAIPYSLEMKAMKYLPTHVFGLLMSLEPVVASTMGYLNLNEKLNLHQLLAITLIVVASIGCTYTTASKISGVQQ